jgi:hypothetical protein
MLSYNDAVMLIAVYHDMALESIFIESAPKGDGEYWCISDGYYQRPLARTDRLGREQAVWNYLDAVRDRLRSSLREAKSVLDWQIARREPLERFPVLLPIAEAAIRVEQAKVELIRKRLALLGVE